MEDNWMKGISLEEKIKIFEEFSKTGEKLTSNTVYKGYPIGEWGVKIRSACKNTSSKEKKLITLTEEQLERLQDLGILERQIESTIDEKIQSMSEWVRKYPKASIVNIEDFERTVREYAPNEIERDRFMEEYKKIKKYYRYTADRKVRGELTKEKIEACKNANLGGVFGYSDDIENLAKRYGLKERKIFYLLNKYGTIEKFVKLYRQDELEGDDLKFAQKTIKRTVSIGQSDYLNNYDMLVEAKRKVMKKNNGIEPFGELILYLTESIDNFLGDFNTRDQKLIEDKYGLKTGKSKKLKELCKNFGITITRVKQIEKRVLGKCDYKSLKITAFLKEESNLISSEEKARISKLEETINSSNIVFLTVPEEQRELDRNYLLKETKFLVELRDRIEERKVQAQEMKNFHYIQKEKRLTFDINQKEEMQNLEEELKEKGIPISSLCLPERAYKSLLAAGYITVESVMNLNKKEFLKIKGLGEKTVDKIFEFLKPYRVGYWEQRCNSFETQRQVKREELRVRKEEFERKLQKERLEFEGKKSEIDEKEAEKKTDDKSPIDLEKLKLSFRAHNCLKRAGFNTLEDIIELTEDELMKISKLGKNSAKEILEKVELYKKQELEDNQSVNGEICEYEDSNAQELDEVQEDKKTTSNFSELNSVRIQRDELKAKNSQMKVKIEKAQELLEQYDIVLGENMEEKKPSLDD